MKVISKITIPKRITAGEELIVIRRQEQEQLLKYLAEVKDALAKIKKGERELKEGKTRIIRSLADLRSQGVMGRSVSKVHITSEF